MLASHTGMLDALVLVVPVLLLTLLLWRPLRVFIDPWRGRVAVCLAILVVLPLGAWVARTPRLQLTGDLLRRVDTSERVVALTFDDGPETEAAMEIARVLRERDARATFFLNGAQVEAHPEVIRALAADGHELGNHTWSHPRLLFRSVAFVREQLESTDAALRRAGYGGPIPFRAPYGKKLLTLPWVLRDEDRVHVTWDVAPDSENAARSSDELVRDVVEGVRPGSIVLLHVMYPSRRTSREAVPGIIDGLRSRGYRLVTVSELLALRGA